MRPHRQSSTFFIAVLALILALSGLAQARDFGERRMIPRSSDWSGMDIRSHSRGNYHHESRSTIGFDRHSGRRDYGDIRRSRHERNGWSRHSSIGRDWNRRDVIRRDGDRRDWNGRHGYRSAGRSQHWDNRFRNDRVIRNRDRRDERFDRSGDDDRFPTYAPGGTYFGGLSAWHEPDNGTYFDRDRYGSGYDDDGSMVRDERRSGPKIIRVNPRTSNRACSYESGVCVIRR